jgi:hypothetical protein
MKSVSNSGNSYTPKQIATHNRQKCIQLLEKIMKNLFRMFRNKTTTKEQLNKRFFELKEKLDQLGDVYVDAEYHREMRTYVEQIALTFAGEYALDDIRDKNMSRLNRIQKLKNAT